MIRRLGKIAFPLLALTIAACQSTSPVQKVAAASPMDGKWASADGVFVASFRDGQFTSRFTKTNEVLAQGTYTIEGSRVDMRWLSVATKQQRSASCTILGAGNVHCNPVGGTGFDLNRIA
jgi:hypothetical protein